MRKSFAVLVSACIAVLADIASPARAAPVPKPPKPDFSSMRFELGTWACKVRVAHRGSTAYTATYFIDPSGYFFVRRITDRGAPWFPHPTTRTVMMTYDRDANRWVRILTSNFGDYELDVANDRTSEKRVWHAVVPPSDGYQSDLTITKLSDTHEADYRTVTTKTGTTVVSRGDCTKT